MITEHGRINVDSPTRFNANDTAAMIAVARAGHGIINVFDFGARSAIAAGELVVLEGLVGPSWPIHALSPRNGHLIAKVSSFVDFAVELFAETSRSTPPRDRGNGAPSREIIRGKARLRPRRSR